MISESMRGGYPKKWQDKEQYLLIEIPLEVVQQQPKPLFPAHGNASIFKHGGENQTGSPDEGDVDHCESQEDEVSGTQAHHHHSEQQGVSTVHPL